MRQYAHKAYTFGAKYHNEEVVYEINNGKGNIKEYDGNYEIIFEGEYLNG